MSKEFNNRIGRIQKSIPGRGFLKNFFRVHGPLRTLKWMYFYYYNQSKLRRLSLDPTKNHIVKVNNYLMLIIPTDKGISAELAIFNSHEPLTTKVLLSQLSKGMVCLDVGSNIGYYALLESRIVGKEGKVICIEPSPLNFQYLKKNLEMGGQQSDIEIHNIAVGDVDGDIDFITDTQSNLCRVVKENEQTLLTDKYDNKDNSKNNNNVIRVPIKQIDSLMEREISTDKLDFVRMDPEGFEASIYQGMKTTIRKYKPMLLIEFHRNFLGTDGTRNLLQDLSEDGYESLYYIPRLMDYPVIAKMKYVQRIAISELVKKLNRDSLPAGFNLFLSNRNV